MATGRFRRVQQNLQEHNWLAAAVDLVIVVLGIFIGLQANQWVQARQEVDTERRYLGRLLVDGDANIDTLQKAIGASDRSAAILASLATALDGRGPVPSGSDLSGVLCRWFIQPAVNVRRGTYDELVSSGRLALLRDEELRRLIALEQASHDEAARLDILVPAILQAAAPINDYRQWRLIEQGARAGPSTSFRGVDCTFDIAAMRTDPRIASVIAQLYRDHGIHKDFRQREVTAVRATQDRLRQLLG